jgi:glycosyltransferase involved in cell wall biosynthesis
MRPKILYITSRVPDPEIGGFNLRVRGTIRALQKHYDVHLVCLSPQDVDPATIENLEAETAETRVIRYSRIRSATRALLRFGSNVPLLTQIYNDGSASKWINQNAASYDLIWCHLVRTAEFASNFEGPKILDMADAIGRHYSSAAPTGSRLWRKLRQIEANKTTRYELDACRRFDQTYVHTESDRASLIEHDSDIENRIAISPMGIPEEFFASPSLGDTQEPQETKKIVFLGKMNYEPNVDAVEYFANEVFPIIQKKHHDAVFQIVGAYPTPRITRLGKLNGVEVTGFVDSPAEYLSSATAVVAPIRSGGGIQNKVIQAMAASKPVVTTSLGATGVGAASGSDYLVADSADETAECVSRILGDPSLANALGKSGHEFVRSRFSWADIDDTIHRDVERLLGQSEQ